jgi:FAD/FMN-containing dehydrogenase
VDSLVSVDVVTADGRVTTASADSNSELFWGMRGAGHNLAIATSFTFKTHAIGPQVMSGMLIFSPDDAVALCAEVDDIMSRAPRELSLPLIFAPAPPLPGLPPEAIGQPILIAVVIYTGPLESYDEAVGEVLSLVTPLANLVRPMSWIETNSMLDAFQPIGRRYQSKGAYVSAMSADLARLAIQRVAAAPAATPTASCLVGFPMLGGALLDVDEDATAFSRVGASWVSEIVAMWDTETDDGTYLDWVEESLAALVPHSPGTGYVNLTADQGPAWLRTVYGSPEKWARLVALKNEWDPDNLLAYNKNIALASAPEPA